MRRVRLTTVAVLLGTLGAAPAASAATASLTRAQESAFPNRSFVLALPKARRVNRGAVVVREDGKPVESLSVLPANQASGRQLAVVLVVDTSRSMKGAPIADAMTAARTFVTHRNPQQQIGVVTFNGTSAVRLPLTSDGPTISKALAGTPTLGSNTHIYDAVGVAIQMLKSSQIAAGSIVLLSDGSDTGSALGANETLARANADGVRIYSVGLRSGAFNRSTLEGLASRTQGLYSEASSSRQLAQIYDELGSQLSSQYLIRYRSLARPGTRVTVTAFVPGTSLSATTSYATPALPSHASPPFHRSFWQSAPAALLAALAVTVLIGFSVLFLLRGGPTRRPLRARLADFVSPPPTDDAAARRPTITTRIVGSATRALDRKEWWGNFKEELEVARIRIPAGRIVAITIVATGIAIWLLWALAGSALVGLLGLGTPFAVRALIRYRLEQQRRLFSEQLADNLQVIASAMRAGQSFIGALNTALTEAPEPVRSEFRRVVEDERLGVPVEEAMRVVARRMRNGDMEQVQLVAALQRQTGGNSADVLEQVADTIRGRMELRRTIRTLTAQGRLSRWVLTALPVVLLLVISALNPGYLAPLLHTSGGKVWLVIAAVMVAGGSYAIKRIVEIKV